MNERDLEHDLSDEDLCSLADSTISEFACPEIHAEQLARGVLRLLSERPTENQKTITAWANETFGHAHSVMRVVVRANEEMAELLRALSTDDHSRKAAAEIADVIIVLCRAATMLGVDITEEVDKKMKINRARRWNVDGTGHGYHVRDKSEAA
jgi:NTP pyrophosphatase (non-canonical NTP hydrolase)